MYYSDDNTLLDPAQGAYNYSAPGADRLKLTPTLTVLGITDTIPDNFIERVVIEDGFVKERYDKTVYNVIRDYMAQRTYDESGDPRHALGDAARELAVEGIGEVAQGATELGAASVIEGDE